MPASKLNLRLDEATSFGPIPDDTYPAEVVSISDPKKGAKATYVETKFKITEGEYEGRQFFTNYMLDGKAAGMFVDFINKATGSNYNVDDLRSEGLEIDKDDLIGRSIAIVLKQEEYPEGSGDFRSKVAGTLAIRPREGSSAAARRAKRGG